MFRGSGKKTFVAAGATVLVAAASLAVVPLVASAAGTSPTSTSVAAHPTATTTGHQLTLVAQVTSVTPVASTVHAARAATGNSSVPTGTVTFTVTGSNASTVNCKNSNTVTISKRGKASCKVLKGQLQAVDSPYAVSATYSGDTNFAGSTGLTSVTVTRAPTSTRLKIGPSRPVSGSPNAVTATVRTKGGEALLSGSVTFAVASSPATGKTTCTNDNGSGKPKTYDTQPLAVSNNVATAVCDLQPGWFVISKVTPANKHAHGSWNVSGSYSGDSNFLPSTGKKSGHSNM
jgi:hypothetical protein